MNITKRYFFILTIASILFSGCVRRDMDQRPNDGVLEITLDWKRQTPPLAVCYLLYNQRGDLFKKVEGSAQGTTQTLPVGEYHLVAYSLDAQQVGYRGLEYHNTAEVFAQSATPADRSRADDYYVLQPQAVFGASSCMDVGSLVVNGGKTVRYTAEPRPLTKKMKFRFTITNATNIKWLNGALHGIAPSVLLTTGNSNFAQLSATSFVGKTGDANICTVDMDVFDLLASEQLDPNTNTMTITMEADDKHYEFTTDLTKVLRDIIDKNGGTIPIEIPIDIKITANDEGIGAIAIVRPWDDGGSSDNDVN